MGDEPISRSVNICGQTLDVDPRTGRTEVNHARPFSKRDWNEIATPRVIAVVDANGNESGITIAGAKHKELRDVDFICSVTAGRGVKHRITDEQWHAYVLKLAARYPDRVMQGPPRPPEASRASRVIRYLYVFPASGARDTANT